MVENKIELELEQLKQELDIVEKRIEEMNKVPLFNVITEYYATFHLRDEYRLAIAKLEAINEKQNVGN